MRVGIKSPLLDFAEVWRQGGLVQGNVVWYEDFSSGCSFCDSDDHIIDNRPLLNSFKKEVKVTLIKNPKQKCLYENLANANQENIEHTVEQANVVQAKVKNVSFVPKSLKKSVPPKKRLFIRMLILMLCNLMYM